MNYTFPFFKQQQSQYRKKLFEASHCLRSMMFGQDRYRRRYWILPQCGGVFVEGMESGEGRGHGDPPLEAGTLYSKVLRLHCNSFHMRINILEVFSCNSSVCYAFPIYLHGIFFASLWTMSRFPMVVNSAYENQDDHRMPKNLFSSSVVISCADLQTLLCLRVWYMSSKTGKLFSHNVKYCVF